MDELDFNGYEYVNLGLPSETLWAKCNIGASSPEEIGLYFAWGETIGYSKSDVENGVHSFIQEDYKFEDGDACDGRYTKYDSSDNLTTLEPSDDAVSVNMGGSWHMPSKEQFEELINTLYTTTTWTTVNGVYGRKITSRTNGNTLFFPASGYCWESSVYFIGSEGYFWSRSLDSDFPSNAWVMYFNSRSCFAGNSHSRYHGYALRGVISNGSGTTTTPTTPGPDDLTTTTTTTTTSKPPYSPSTSKKLSHLFIFSSESDYSQVKENLTKPNVSYIKGSQSIKYNAADPFNGYEYVDLGLPSGLKWAKCNIGAEKETDYGLYFAWGEIVGYTANDVKNGLKSFNTYNYKFADGEWQCDGSTMTKYNSSDNLTTLLPEDDAATVIMGGKWRMPSNEEYQELINNTTNTWTTRKGDWGRLFTGNNGNSLFFPASGFCYENDIINAGEHGRYWSSSLPSNNPGGFACYLHFGSYSSSYCKVTTTGRYSGSPVRGVMN